MSVSLPGSPSSRRDVDVDLNYVPLIDVMSALVAFLLLTTVWTQMAQLRITNDVHGAAAPSAQAEPLEIMISRETIFLATPDGARLEIADVDALRQALAASTPAPRASIAAENGVPYSRIVEVMDAALGVGLQRVSFVDESLLHTRFRK